MQLPDRQAVANALSRAIRQKRVAIGHDATVKTSDDLKWRTTQTEELSAQCPRANWASDCRSTAARHRKRSCRSNQGLGLAAGAGAVVPSQSFFDCKARVQPASRVSGTKVILPGLARTGRCSKFSMAWPTLVWRCPCAMLLLHCAQALRGTKRPTRRPWNAAPGRKGVGGVGAIVLHKP